MKPPAGPKTFGTIVHSADLGGIESDQNGGSFGIYGLDVFVKGFFRNLLKYSAFDEFHIFSTGFLPSPGKKPGPAAADGLIAADPRVRLRSLGDFAQAVTETDYVAFHNPWGPDIGPWIDLRNRLATRNIPVTGLTHTISFQSLLPRILLTLFLDVRPWDSIVCTADPAVAVMRNWVAHLRDHLSGRMDLDFSLRLDKIPLAVDADAFQPADDKAPHRRRLGLPEDQVIVLYMGRFSRYDKMDLAPLLLAFKKAAEQRPEPCTLVLAGADARFQYAVELEAAAVALGISGSVRILTDIPASDVAGLYQAADVFVSPSDNLQETFGLTVVEAMASGLPVVCSDWDGYRDLVVPNETGFLVPTYWQPCDSFVADIAGLWEPEPTHFYLGQTVAVDVELMASALASLIAKPELRHEMGAAGRRRVHQRFDWRTVIRQYEELWAELNRVAGASPFAGVTDSWFRPNYSKVFEGYGSLRLDSATLVQASAEVAALPRYQETDSWIRADVSRTIYESAREPIALKDLEAAVTARTGIAAEQFSAHLLRMLKYGELIKL
jgi:D-inositol-3-phosphate glycosyltransferase